MIKSLFEPDEHKTEEIKTELTEKTADAPAVEKADAPQYIEVNEAENLFSEPEMPLEKPDNLEKPLSADEIESISSFVETSGDANESSNSQSHLSEKNVVETTKEAEYSPEPQSAAPDNLTVGNSDKSENEAPFVQEFDDETAISIEPRSELFDEMVDEPTASETFTTETVEKIPDFDLPAEMKTEEARSKYDDKLLFQPPAEPESFAETARKSGLAYAAAITLTASIVFMLVIGWFADLLFGSSPLGIVGGIILGSLIGFVQFFRMTAQIFKNKD